MGSNFITSQIVKGVQSQFCSDVKAKDQDWENNLHIFTFFDWTILTK